MASPFPFALQKVFECEHSTFTGLPRFARWTLMGGITRKSQMLRILFFFGFSIIQTCGLILTGLFSSSLRSG
jgi:hypothetical protein